METIDLTGKCMSCFNPNGIFVHSRENYYCPACALREETSYAAEEHLLDLLEPVVTLWYNHHLTRGTNAKLLADVLEVSIGSGGSLSDRFRDGILPDKNNSGAS